MQVVRDEKPYERIPAECFTNTYDCQVDPDNRCCDFQWDTGQLYHLILQNILSLNSEPASNRGYKKILKETLVGNFASGKEFLGSFVHIQASKDIVFQFPNFG